MYRVLVIIAWILSIVFVVCLYPFYVIFAAFNMKWLGEFIEEVTDYFKMFTDVPFKDEIIRRQSAEIKSLERKLEKYEEKEEEQ